MKIKLIRRATLSLQYSGQKIIIDPYFADKFSLPSYTGKSKNPTTDLPCSVDDIMLNVNAVLVSHLHSDHFDPKAKEYISKSIPIICQEEDVSDIKKMGFTATMPVNDRCSLSKIEIQRIIGKHGEGNVLKEMGISSGFYFKSEDESDLFWAGDTILYNKLEEFLLERKPKIIITHSSGATWGNGVKIIMDEVQTIKICKMLPDSIVIATHMESLDHLTVSRKQLREYAGKNNINREQLIIPDDGEELVF
ncbi:MAG: MBL fold metallo-hydrolase [bacterium]|nr:MBL fold metallo-hydrolase [bacterium]